jgi:hypothetical protein
VSSLTATYERASIPDEDYRSALLALLAAQAAPVWGVGQQEPYEAFVMDGASLEHWVRMSGVWAEVERNVWQLQTLLERLGGGPIPSSPLMEDAIESWVDLLFTEVIVDNLGRAMVQACQHSSYAPLARIARLLAFSKMGAFASGVVGLREAASRRQVPATVLRDRAGRWLDIGSALAQQIDEAQRQAGWVTLDIAATVDTDAAISEAEANIDQLLEAGR